MQEIVGNVAKNDLVCHTVCRYTDTMLQLKDIDP